MKTLICIASGPSLIRPDCEIAINTRYPIIAVNSSWRLVPECHCIYAADFRWWEKHCFNITSYAERWSSSVNATMRFGLNHFPHPDTAAFNSGQRAIQLAAHLGADRIILLGYDCSLTHGTHWHGEHPTELKNPDKSSVERWRGEFSRIADSLHNVEIINCSRETSLTSFDTSTLEKVFHA